MRNGQEIGAVKGAGMWGARLLHLATQLEFKSSTYFAEHIRCAVGVLQQPAHILMQGGLVYTNFARDAKRLYPGNHRGHSSERNCEGDGALAADEYRESMKIFGRKCRHRGMSNGFRQHIAVVNTELIESVIAEDDAHSSKSGSWDVAQHHKLGRLQQRLRLASAPIQDEWRDSKRQRNNCGKGSNDGAYSCPEISLVAGQYRAQRSALRGKPRSRSACPFAQVHHRFPVPHWCRESYSSIGESA